MTTAPTSDKHPLISQWLTLGIALLILGSYIAFSLFTDYQDLDTITKERMVSQAKVIGDEVEGRLLSANSTMSGIIGDLPYWNTQKNGAEMAQRQLKALSSAMEGVRTMILYDAEGSVVASDRSELLGQNFKQRDYFQELLRNPDPRMVHVGPPFTTALGAYAINLLRVVPGADGRLAGVVSVTLDTDDLRSVLDSMRYTPGLALGLVHGGGKPLLYVPEPPGLKEMNLARPGTFFSSHFESGNKFSVVQGRSRILDGERLVVLRTVHPAGLSMSQPLLVSVSRDVREVFAPWRRDVYIQAGLYAALTLVSALALYLLQRRRRTYELMKVEQEARYRLLADNMADVLWTMDLERRQFTYVSPSVERLRGYTVEEVLAQPLEAALTPQSLVQVTARIAQRVTAFLAGDPDAVTQADELEQPCKNGSTVWTEVISTYLKNDHGGITVVAVTRDISQRRQAEQALRQQAEELRRNNAELTRFNQVAVGRELRMIELKHEVDVLCDRLGEAPRYAFHADLPNDPPGAQPAPATFDRNHRKTLP